jgi:hypothetical protein
LVRHSAKRWPLTSRNDRTWPALAVMDKLFLAVMVSCILVLIAAAGLSMTLRKETTAVQKTTFEMIRQQRH